MGDWTQTRKKGKKRFILVYGVLFFGLLSGVLFQVIQYFVFSKPITITGVIIPMILFPVCGYFWGKVMWNRNERAIGNIDE